MLANRTSYRGFTLLETVIALALIVCCMALLFPSWKGLFQSTTTASATTLLLTSFEEARLNALQKHAETWIVFQHCSQGDRYCSLQRGENGIFHLLRPWLSLPSSMAWEITPESIIMAPPPSEVLDALSENTSKAEGNWGALCYNTSGAIVFPASENHFLHLDLSTKVHQRIIHEQILFSPLTGRALRKSDF